MACDRVHEEGLKDPSGLFLTQLAEYRLKIIDILFNHYLYEIFYQPLAFVLMAESNPFIVTYIYKKYLQTNLSQSHLGVLKK